MIEQALLTPGLAAGLMLLTACEPTRPVSRVSVEPPPASCELVDRIAPPGRRSNVCVLIGRGNVVRGGGGTAWVEVCNTSGAQRVWVAWAGKQPVGQGPAAVEAMWKSSGNQRRSIPAHDCIRIGPAAAVMLRGWRDGGQGYDLGTDWRATVTFDGAPTPGA